jgi:hypothetical protein
MTTNRNRSTNDYPNPRAGRLPLPWSTPPVGPGTNQRDTNAARHSFEEYCVAWAQRHPLETLLCVWWIWGIYSGIAPAVAVMSKSQHGGVHRAVAGYTIPARMTRAAGRSLFQRFTHRLPNK